MATKFHRARKSLSILPLVAATLMTSPGRAESSEELVRAAANGSTALVRKLLDEGADIEEVNRRGLTPLMASADNGFIEVMRMLLDAGAKVDRGSSMKYPALTYAAFGGHYEAVQLLLEHDARPDEAGTSGMTPLLAACTASEPRSVRALLEKGADIAAKDEQGRTSLMFAAISGDVPTIDILLAAGAALDRRSSDGYTALELASVYQWQEVLVRLGGDPALAALRPADTPVMAAVMAPDIQPPTIEKQTKPRYTADALHRKIVGEVLLKTVISRQGRIEAVRVLSGIDAGLDLNAIACVRQWRFHPAMRAGEPIDLIAEIAVAYHIY